MFSDSVVFSIFVYFAFCLVVTVHIYRIREQPLMALNKPASVRKKHVINIHFEMVTKDSQYCFLQIEV